MAVTLTLRSITGQTLATHRLDAPLTLRAQPRVQYLLADDNGLAANATATRAGNDLLVAIDGETALRLEDYFLADDSGLANPLLGMNASGQYVAYPIADAALPLEHTLAAKIATSGGATPVAALAAVGGIALTGAVIANSRKENTATTPDTEQPQTPYDPNQPLPPADNGNPTPPPSGGGNPPPPPVNPPPTPTPNNPPTGEVKITGEAQVGKTLTASHTLKDPDGLGQITYKWFANGQEVGQGNTYTLQPSDKGKTITVKAEYTDGKGHAESVESAATAPVTDPVVPPVPNNPPTGEVQISGTPEVGKTLTASHTLQDSDGLGQITYKWFANGQEVGQGSTYTIQSSDKGKTITVKAEYTDGKGHAESVESAATPAVIEPAPPPPVPNNPPTGEVQISGTPEVGKTLTASHTLKDNDGLGQITYRWFANGQEVGQGNTYTLQPSDKDKTLTVKAEYTDGKGHAESVTSAATDPVVPAAPNNPPTGEVKITGDAEVGKTLTVSHTLKDPDGLGQITYRWFANDTEVGQGSTYTLQPADKGKVISVKAEYTDGKGNDESVYSDATPPVADPPGQPPSNNPPEGLVTIVGANEIGAVLSINQNLEDADGLGKITYRWFADGREVGQGDTYTVQASDKGKTIIAKAEYTDGKGNHEVVESNETLPIIDPAAPPPTNTPPTGEVQISGTPEVGKTLSASHTLKDDDGLGTVTYRWFADGAEVGQGEHYTLQPSDKGKTITVKAEYTDARGHAESVESAATPAVTDPVTPTPNNPPSGEVQISGTPEVGKTLSASHTLQDDDGLGTVTYKWFADGQQIGTGASYTLQPSDKGKTISVKAEYVDGKGHAESVTSAATAAVTEPATPPPADAPTVSLLGDTQVVEGQEAGYTLVLDKPAPRDITVTLRVVHDNSNDDDIAATTYTVVIAKGSKEANILIPTLDNDSFAHGKTFRVVIDAADGAKIDPQGNSATTAIADNDPPPPPQLEHGAEKGSVVITPADGTQALTVYYRDESGTEQTLQTHIDANRKLWVFYDTPPQHVQLDAQSGVLRIGAAALENGSEVRAVNASEYNVSTSSTLHLNDNASTPDTTAPVLTISADKPFLGSKGESAQLTFKLSEPVQNFAANDIQVTNGRIDNFTQIDATTYTATYTGVGSGDIRVAAGAFSDLAFNQNGEATLRIPLSTPGKVVISGLPKVGEVLTATVADDNGVPNDVQYQWFAGDQPINGATQSSYTVRAEDAGKAIHVRAVYQDEEGFGEDLASDATAQVQNATVHTFANIGELIAAPLNASDKATIVDFNHVNDNIEIGYTIVDTLPDHASGLLNRVAVPLANGKYALPELADHDLPVANSAANVEAMLQVARTYLDAGDKLVWDGKGQTPLYVQGTPQMVKTPDGKDAFAITCSAFINMVMAGWKFEDTTYATTENTSSYGWGIDFADKPQGDSGPYGANAQLKWMYWKDQVALYNGKSGGEENYRVGDILFFSKQDPEGAGTGGVYFMNVYHSAIYIGNGQVMHSAGTYHGNGVVIESLDNLKADLTWIGRPHLGNSAITIEGKAETGQPPDCGCHRANLYLDRRRCGQSHHRARHIHRRHAISGSAHQ